MHGGSVGHGASSHSSCSPCQTTGFGPCGPAFLNPRYLLSSRSKVKCSAFDGVSRRSLLSFRVPLWWGYPYSRAAPCWLGCLLVFTLPDQIYADPSKRLELYFRPQDPYCHPLCANRFSTTSLLLRVRKKVRRQRAAPGPGTQPEVAFDMEILGIVSTIYKFQGTSLLLGHACTRPAWSRLAAVGTAKKGQRGAQSQFWGCQNLELNQP